jgi:hypothetical protein
MEDLYIDVENKLKEFTDIVLIDYERESILLEVHKNYLDEILKITKNSLLGLEVVFLKEIKKDIYTIVVCVPQIIDVYDE